MAQRKFLFSICVLLVLGSLVACAEFGTTDFSKPSATSLPSTVTLGNETNQLIPTHVLVVPSPTIHPSRVSSPTPLIKAVSLLTQHFELPRNTLGVDFSPDNSLVAIAATDILILDAMSGHTVWSISANEIAHYKWLQCGLEPAGTLVAFSGDGSKLAIANACGGVFFGRYAQTTGC